LKSGQTNDTLSRKSGDCYVLIGIFFLIQGILQCLSLQRRKVNGKDQGVYDGTEEEGDNNYREFTGVVSGRNKEERRVR
jgi:hypothetical protein